MHRSGSSVITKGIQILGVDLGSSLLGPAPDNPYGFFEDIDIGQLNDTILYTIQFAADSVGNFPKNVPNEDALISYGCELIKQKIAGKQRFGFKDPRTARNITIWRKIFKKLTNISLRIIVVTRNPKSIAKSLYARNQIPYEKSYYLYLQHYISAILYTLDLDPYFMSYENFIKNPNQELQKVAKYLNINNIDTKKLDDFTKNFVNRAFQHHNSSEDAVMREKEIPNEVKSLYLLLNNVFNFPSSKQEIEKKCKKIHSFLEQHHSILKSLDEAEEKHRMNKYAFGLIENLVTDVIR
ncbi:MAG: hypothetical protein K940chlam8_00494 [Chlamydiae bacterium]|nr:hypothetical protein [Chlamydiota bacterium]